LAAQSVFLQVGALFTLVGFVFLGVGVTLALEERRFATQGVTLDATVVERGIRKANFDDNPSTQYIVRYRVVPAGGQAVVESRVVPVEEWESLPIGSRTRIRFLDGASARAIGESDWEAPIIFSTLGLMLLLVGVPSAFAGVRQAWASAGAS
jgi:hypothetical protein